MMEMDMTTTRVYKYGAVPLEQIPEPAIEELFKANKLWNRLVELHREHRDKFYEARGKVHSGYAKISKEIDEKNKEISKACEAKRTARMKAGTKDANHPLVKAANEKIKSLKGERSALYQARKPLAKEADKILGDDRKKQLNRNFDNDVNEAARKEQSQISGELANSIKRYFRKDRTKAFKEERAELQFHPFDGTGFWRYRNCLREVDPKTGKKKNQDGTTLPKLLVGNKGFAQDGRAFVLKLKKQTEKRTVYELRAKLAGGAKKDSKIYGRFDLIMHRPLPKHAQIQFIQLNRHRNGDKFTYAATFTLRLPDPKPRQIPARTIGVDLGFRKFFEEDGRIRIAAIAASDLQNEKEVEFIELSKELYLTRLDYIDSLKSELDDSATQLGETLLPILKGKKPMPDEAGNSWHRRLNKMRKWQKNITLSFEDAYKLARWLEREPENKKLLGDAFCKAVRDWWESNNRNRENGKGGWNSYREMHNLRRKALAARKEYYRIQANRLIALGLPIVFEKLDLSRMARVKDDDNKLGNQARYQRFIGSPSEFRDAVKNAASREGVCYLEVPAPYTSKKCSECGTLNKKLGAEPEWTCSECGVVHDRDINAAVNIARKGLEELGKEFEKERKNSKKN